MDDKTLVTPSARATYRSIADGESAVILHLDSGAYYQLNAVGARIWEILGTGSTVGGVIDALRVELADAPADLGSDVEHFFRDLVGLDLVHLNDPREDERPQ